MKKRVCHLAVEGISDFKADVCALAVAEEAIRQLSELGVRQFATHEGLCYPLPE